MSKVWIPMTGHIAFGLANGEIKMCDAHHIDGLPFPDDVAICRLTDDAAAVDMQLIAAAAERLTLSDLEMERDLGYRLLTMVAKLQEANNE